MEGVDATNRKLQRGAVFGVGACYGRVDFICGKTCCFSDIKTIKAPGIVGDSPMTTGANIIDDLSRYVICRSRNT